jgi:hypothetical protein
MVKTTIERITSFCIREFRDNGQVKAYCEWVDNRGVRGRTEGVMPLGPHMRALEARARREGVTPTREVWG